ncbi:hypothetical protein AA103196_1738 [Ameyamaea chiangmaiensis NBRC 103196]|nr:hypothetical protein AA103196_1738 [Ameyamaea chiangmaiensis NBRC 103196]
MAAIAGAPAAAGRLAAHRVIYDLTLEHVSGGSVMAASGTMSYTVEATCGGWAVQQRLHLTTASRDGGSSDLTSDYATLESLDGRHFVFDMRQGPTGGAREEIKGDAALNQDGAGTASYTLPKASRVALPKGTLFPMHHTAAIVDAAASGQPWISPLLFDGTGVGGALSTFALFGHWGAPSPEPIAPSMAAMASGPVHVSYFGLKPGVSLPDFESIQRYYDNGVADRLHLDFGDFRMQASVRDFHLLPSRPAHCER